MNRLSKTCSLLVALALLGAVPGCEKEGDKKNAPSPEKASEKLPSPPESVLGVLAVPGGEGIMAFSKPLARLSPKVSVGLSVGLSDVVRQIGSKLLDDPSVIDADAPMHFVLMSTKKFDPPLVWIGEAKKKPGPVGSNVAVRKVGDGWMAGAPDALDALGDYAKQLAGHRQAKPLVALYPRALVATYRREIEQAPQTLGALAPPSRGGPNMEQLIKVYADLALGAGKQVESVLIYPTAGDDPTLVLSFVPRDGSTLAKLCSKQKAANFDLDRLPPMPDTDMIAASELHLGAAMDALIDFSSSFFGAEEQAKEFRDIFRTIFDAMKGDMAMIGRLQVSPGAGAPRMDMAFVAGVEDPKVAERSIRDFGALLGERPSVKVFGMEQSYAFHPEVETYDGIAIHENLTHTAASPAMPAIDQRQRIALVDDLLVMRAATGGGDVTEPMHESIDAARKKKSHFEPSATEKRVFAAAREAHASAVMFLDLGKIMPPSLAAQAQLGSFGLFISFPDGTLRLDLGFWPAK